jgi:hypothetical protein
LPSWRDVPVLPQVDGAADREEPKFKQGKEISTMTTTTNGIAANSTLAEQRRRRVVANWVTIGITPLPLGWVNVYRVDPTGLVAYPAPALLLQECTSVTVYEDYPRPDGSGKFDRVSREKEQDRETRAVFADVESGYLCEVDGDNYIDSMTEAEFQRLQAKSTSDPA